MTLVILWLSSSYASYDSRHPMHPMTLVILCILWLSIFVRSYPCDSSRLFLVPSLIYLPSSYLRYIHPSNDPILLISISIYSHQAIYRCDHQYLSSTLGCYEKKRIIHFKEWFRLSKVMKLSSSPSSISYKTHDYLVLDHSSIGFTVQNSIIYSIVSYYTSLFTKIVYFSPFSSKSAR